MLSEMPFRHLLDKIVKQTVFGFAFFWFWRFGVATAQ